MSDQQITDLSYLENMGMGDNTLIIEMIELFLQNTPEALRAMKDYEVNGDWEKLGEEAHKLKPNLSYMGLEGAKDIIIEIEDQVKKKSGHSEISDKISEIEAICKQAYTELTEKRDELLS